MKETRQVAEITISYKPTVTRMPTIRSSNDAYEELKEFFSEDLISLQEQFVVMYLNQANGVLGIQVLSTGGITGTFADPRLVLGTALKAAATGLIISHNHPSGNLKPSEADLLMTRRIKEAGKLMEINLLDHLIITPEGKYLSFIDEGLI
ncbi:MAG: JAB domain-containing protein [Bacteroidota bacterium]